MKYHIRIYENSHYMDESEAYEHGNYSSYEEAVIAAQGIVREFLEHNWSESMTPEELLTQFALYGDDPVILPNEHGKNKRFSAREYAQEIAEEVCGKHKPHKEDVQTLYQKAIKFAAVKHQQLDQKVKGTNLPYVVHLSNVVMEILMASKYTPNFNLQFAIQVALLHDTLEDTETTFDEIKKGFGEEVALAVMALSKDDNLPKDEQIEDSIERIKDQPDEVWAVKLADRISNLQPAPKEWTLKKRKQYLEDAKLILEELGDGNDYLAERLEAKIYEYGKAIKG